MKNILAKVFKSIFWTGIIGATVVIVVSVIVIIGLIIYFATSSDVPRPKIKYGEFPISITYEVGGEVKVIEDTVICEFDGIERLGEAGKYRKWRSRLKSGDDSLAFFPVEQNVVIEVGIFRGFPSYYMGDYSERSKEDCERSMADDRYREYVEWRNGIKTGNIFTKEEVWEKYKLRIIDVQYSLPIENTFK